MFRVDGRLFTTTRDIRPIRSIESTAVSCCHSSMQSDERLSKMMPSFISALKNLCLHCKSIKSGIHYKTICQSLEASVRMTTGKEPSENWLVNY